VLSLFGSFGNESAYHEMGTIAADFEHHVWTLHPDEKSSRTKACYRICVTLMLSHKIVEYTEN
jgi:hypothetical protein